jgi:hypothetical protein
MSIVHPAIIRYDPHLFIDGVAVGTLHWHRQTDFRRLEEKSPFFKITAVKTSNLTRFEVFTAETMKNADSWDVDLVRTDVSEESVASIIRVRRISD